MNNILDELRKVGLLVENVVNKEGFTRCPTQDKPNSKNGAYSALGDGKCFYWQNWATGESGIVPAGVKLTAKERKDFTEARRKEEEITRAKNLSSALIAEKTVSSCPFVETHKYLRKKEVEAFGLYIFQKDKILIPLYDNEGKIWTYQTIDEQGNKKFLFGGKKKGCFFRIEGDDTILLCEGYATGASLHMATKHTVIVCFDAGNMLEVSKSFPNAICCADNDISSGTGAKFAKKTGLRIVMPPAHEGADTDFNDIHTKRGLNAVRECFKTPEEFLCDDLFTSILEIKDVVLRERKIITARETSTVLGVTKEFDALLKAHKARAKNGISRKTSFGDNEDVECGHWVADEGGIYTQTQNGDVYASLSPIYPIRKLKNLQSGKEKITLRYKTDAWHTVTLDRSVVASANKIIALSDYGINVTSENTKALVRYISEIDSWNNIPKEESTSKLGWHKGFNDFLPFTDSKIVIDSGESFNAIIDSLSQCGNELEYINFVKDCLNSKRKEVCFLFAASIASVLIEPMGGLPFIVHLYGQAGKGKTLSTMLAASVWGNPIEGGFLADPKNTSTSFEVNLNLLNSLPFICDDTNKIAQKGQQDFSQLIYLLCSGSGKQRSNVNLGLEPLKKWCNTTITNGEKSLVTGNSHGGEMLRVIEIEMEEGDLFADGHGTAEFLRKNYGFFGRKFIQFLLTEGIDKIKDIQKSYVKMFLSKPDSAEKEGKQIQSMAFLMTAMACVSKMLEIDRFIDTKTAYDMIKNVNDVSDVRRGYSTICDLIRQNKNAFRADYEPMVRWGWIEDIEGEEIAYVFPTQISELCKIANVDRRLLTSWCAKENLLYKQQRPDGTGTFRLGGEKKVGRFFAIKIVDI